jgi:large subunit ribosomal protein L20
MHGLKKAKIEINRKMLADIAVNDATALSSICDKAKKQLAK